MQARILDRLERGTLDLPLLPGSAAEVMAAAGRDDCDARRLADLIRRDQAMAGHLLRVANSPLHAPRAPIVSLQQAVSRLGLAAIREIALLVACRTRVFRVPGYEDLARALYRHSLAAALFAQEIARLRRWNVESAFLGGLLHDVGRPVLLQALADLAAEDRAPLDPIAAAACVDSLHARTGAALCARWSLPPALAETILHHHQPDAAPTCSRDARVVLLADALAHHALDGGDEAALAAHPSLAPLNLYPDDLAALLARAPVVVASVEAIG